MKKLISILLAVVLTLALCACGGSGTSTTPAASSGSADAKAEAPEAKADPVVLKVSIGLPEDTPFSIAFLEMADKISERTNGQYQLKAYFNGTLCSKPELFEMMANGAVDVGETILESMVDSDIRFGAVSLPFAFNSTEASQVFSKLANERLYDQILREKWNIMPLATFCTGFQQFGGTDCSVATLDDWKGKLVWCSNTIGADTVTALGASPVILEFWDGYPALQKGTVDCACAFSAEGVSNFKWYDVVKNISICNMFSSASNVYIRADLFDSFPEDVQQIFREEFAAMEQGQQELGNAMEDRERAELEPLGVTYNEVAESELDAWREAVKPVYDDFWAQMDPADAEIIQQCIEEANATA